MRTLCFKYICNLNIHNICLTVIILSLSIDDTSTYFAKNAGLLDLTTVTSIKAAGLASFSLPLDRLSNMNFKAFLLFVIFYHQIGKKHHLYYKMP